MFRDYSITSPSLDGFLYHESPTYEGIARPSDILRAFDKPTSEQIRELDESGNRVILQDYFNDLYGLFMRKMGQFISDKEVIPEESVKLQALLQELIKVKKVLTLDE
jgi:hypothetical protein